MPELFDRKTYFDAVRASLFSGALSQQQVDGQNAILADWEGTYDGANWDHRWLAYALATTLHETASTMWPIEEYGKGAGQPYGVKDPETGQTYYGRGYVQLTWRENYRNADVKLGHEGGDRMEWNAGLALDPFTAGHVMFRGMHEGWFRKVNGKPAQFSTFLNSNVNDPYGAREIINGDKSKVPDWSNGVSIGNLIKGYHAAFLLALKASYRREPVPEPAPTVQPTVIGATVPPDTEVTFVLNGKVMWTGRFT